MKNTGFIKSIIEKKAFGFIIDPTTRTEYFFHRDDFNGHWNDLIEDYNKTDGQIQVQFKSVHNAKGPRASDVSRMDWPNQSAIEEPRTGRGSLD